METFDPSALSRSDTISTSVGAGKTVANSSSKSTKLANSFQRIDFEPLYTDLKAAIGASWSTYHDALTRFIRGTMTLTFLFSPPLTIFFSFTTLYTALHYCY